MDEHVFRIAEAAKESKTCRTKIYAEISAGNLIARKLGRCTIILGRDFYAWLDRLPTIKPRKVGSVNNHSRGASE